MDDWSLYIFNAALAGSGWIWLIRKLWRQDHVLQAIFLVLIIIGALVTGFWLDDSIAFLLFATFAISCINLIIASRRSSRSLFVVVTQVPLLLTPAGLSSYKRADVEYPRSGPILAPREKQVPDVLKQDCQRLVEGQLVFTPNTTMRQGTPYTVSARLSRGADVNITKGLDGKGIVIENTLVSCMVAMTLDAQEPEALKIENMPAGRKDEQILLANSYTQWDWRVTPLKSGTLHLLLYVTPMIYVDGIGHGEKRFPQPARIITVSPDYMFGAKKLILDHWAIWSVILTVIIIPTLIWLIGKIKIKRDERREAKEVAKRKIGF